MAAATVTVTVTAAAVAAMLRRLARSPTRSSTPGSLSDEDGIVPHLRRGAEVDDEGDASRTAPVRRWGWQERCRTAPAPRCDGHGPHRERAEKEVPPFGKRRRQLVLDGLREPGFHCGLGRGAAVGRGREDLVESLRLTQVKVFPMMVL